MIIRPETVAGLFCPDRALAGLQPLDGGHVNATWLVRWQDGGRAVLQRLAPEIFPEPCLVIGNLETILAHLFRAGWGRSRGGYALPRLLRLPDGAPAWSEPGGGCWRLLTWVEHSHAPRLITSPSQAGAVGRILGRFHRDLADLPPDCLREPLPGFHVTPLYLQKYRSVLAARQDALTREEQELAAWIRDNAHRADFLVAQGGNLARGVIHGDPKAANILFRQERAVALIDLDTAGLGLRLIDLADCLRSCTNPAGEEVQDPGEVHVDPALFCALLENYHEQAGSLLTDRDQALVVEAFWLITFELGLRFFTDHLAGNRYFHTRYPGHNLHRARVQMWLARSIGDQYRELDLFRQRIMMAAT